MARQKYLHKLHIFGRQPAPVKSLHPGMLAQFKYLGDKIFDKEPLVLVIWNDKLNDNIHGINLNYLPENQVQKLFCTCELLHKGASVYSNEPIRRTIQSQMGDYDDTMPYRNLLKESFTRIQLPTYKEKRGGNPLSKSEAKKQMNMLYEKVLKKILLKHNIYRTYTPSKMSSIKVITFKLGQWHQPKLQ